MYTMTGLDGYDWLMLAIGAGGVWLMWWAFRGGPGTRRREVRVIPLLGGLTLMGIALALQPGRTLQALRNLATSPAAWLVFTALVVMVIAVMLLIFVTVFDWYLEQSERRTSWSTTLASNTFVGISTVLIVSIGIAAVAAGSDVDDARTTEVSPLVEPAGAGIDEVAGESGPSEPFVSGWNVQLPGSPLDITHHEPSNSLYVTIGTGEIVRIELDAMLHQAPSNPTVVATGLSRPRGIATVGDRLFVGELYDMPCPDTSVHCRGDDVVDAATRIDGEVKILEQARGRVVEYSVESDGSIARHGILVDDLPVANTDHALNAIIAGDQGGLLLSIGNIDHLRWSIEEYDAVSHPNKHLLGTVIRIDVDTGQSEIVGAGTRNVFGITTDSFGVVWGTDNDGPAVNGHRREEVLRIREGAHFGFPIDGSAPPFVQRTDPAAYTMPSDTSGSGGIQWIDGVKDGQGLLIGSLGKVSFLGFVEADEMFRVPNARTFWVATPASGYVIAIESIGPKAVVFAEWGPNRLHFLGWDDLPVGD